MFWWYIHHQYWTSSCTRATCSVHSIYNIAYLGQCQTPYFKWGELIWVLLMWSMVFDLGLKQCVKKVMSHSSGLVDLAIRLVNFRGKFKLQKDCNQSSSSFGFFWKGWKMGGGGGQVWMTIGLVHATYSLPKWQVVKLTFFAPCKKVK